MMKVRESIMNYLKENNYGVNYVWKFNEIIIFRNTLQQPEKISFDSAISHMCDEGIFEKINLSTINSFDLRLTQFGFSVVWSA